jgi:hypothetical protein
MRENTLVIRINKPSSDVFAFYIDPKNTPKWLSNILEEVTSEWPVKVGTEYRNKNREGEWTEYVVTAFKENELFEMQMKNGDYHVRYSHKTLSDTAMELKYYEWVDHGDLEEPFTMDILETLKRVLEGGVIHE